MSDASRHALSFVPEAVYGTTPNNPALQKLRHTSCTLNLTKNQLQSEELREDRQIAHSIHGARQVAGEISGELSFGTYDKFLEAALMGAWTAVVGEEGAAITAGNTLDSQVEGTFSNLRVGDKLVLSSFTAAANNGTFTIATIAANGGSVTLEENVNTAAFKASAEIRSKAEVLKAGTQRRSFSCLRNFTDIASQGNPFHLFKGIEMSALSLELAPDAIAKVGFTVLGQDAAPPAGSAPAGSAYTAVTDTEPLDSFTGVLKEGGALQGCITEFTLGLDNGLAAQMVVGSKISKKASVDRSTATGQVSVLFEDSTLYEKFVNETESSLSVTMPDVEGNEYEVTLPRIKYNGGQIDVSGPGTLSVPMPFIALYDNATDSQIKIVKRPA